MSRTVIQPWGGTPPCDISTLSPELQAVVLHNAAVYLWALSGRRMGVLATTGEGVRTACTDSCVGPYKGSDGEWRNTSGEPHECCRVELYRQPVRTITEVRLYGQALDAADYHLEGNTLMRNGACWPCCDDCDEPCIEVDYTSGVAVDDLALGELVCEFALAANGDLCKLPSRATTVTRQGVSIDLGDSASLVSEGLTGLPMTDAMIRTYNPARLIQRSRVLSPDLATTTR